MRIKSIRLKNGYKRFHDLTIDLSAAPKKIIALVGPNGSGKSSVFDGMLFLNNQYHAIGSSGAKENSFHSMRGNQINSNDIEIQFDNGLNFGQTTAAKAQTGDANTIFSVRNAYRSHANLNVTEISAIGDIKMNNIGASSSVDLDDKITENYKRLNIYVNEYRKKNKLTDEQAHKQVIGELDIILSACLGLSITDHGDVQAGKGTLYFKKANQPNEFAFNVLSSGEKEVVDILLDIFLKKDHYKDTVFLIDEPELHINTSIQKKLLIELEKLIPDNCQLWVATHSIGFLSALQKELNGKSEIIDFDGDFSQAARTLMPMKKSRSNWRRIFSVALEDLTGLVSPECIIYCEGKVEPDPKGEDQGLDAEVYNEIFSIAHPETLFISSGGNTEPDKHAAIALKVLRKAFTNVGLRLLKDKDINPDGTSTTDDQRNAFIAENPTMHRMLKRREVENYIFDFEVISKVFPAVSEDAYDAIIPDIMGDVKAKAGALKELCGMHGMNKEQFKKHLAKFVTPETSIYIELTSVIF